jgi:hypothetical protein
MRVSSAVGPDTYPRELHDRYAFMVSAACAEAGHPIEPEWDDKQRQYVIRRRIPAEVIDKAKSLVCDALGIEWEWVEWP